GLITFYRGHSKSSYELVPSLYRKNQNGTYRHLASESDLVREILSARPNEFKEDKFTIDKLVRMQHYGLPTRLLDITSNPLIALYFACCSNPDENGQVIAFSTNRKKIKYFDSDTVSCIANLSLLSYEELEKLSSIDARKGSMELPELTDK
ncbi:FRG domain-containing protein, partial [Escherichia coli]